MSANNAMNEIMHMTQAKQKLEGEIEAKMLQIDVMQVSRPPRRTEWRG